MPTHNLSFDTSYTADNDSPKTITYESELARIIRETWNSENTMGLRPLVYNPDNIKTHQLADGPYILIKPPKINPKFVGLDMMSTEEIISMDLEFRTLTYAHLKPVVDEILRILKAHKKHPFLDIDVLLEFNANPVEPVPGNYEYAMTVKYKVFPHGVFLE